MIYLLALLIGVVAGLRAMTAPAAVSWAAYLGWLPVENSWAWFMGHWLTPVDIQRARHRRTGHRPAAEHAEPQGAAAVRRAAGHRCAVRGGDRRQRRHDDRRPGCRVIGAVIGTLGGYEARKRLVAATGGRDLPIALVEDAVAVFGALLIVSSVS